MKKFFCVIVVLFVSISQGICEDKIFFNFDYSVFRDDEGKSILEIYYSVNQQTLIYQKTEDIFEAGAVIDITISDFNTGAIVYSNIYKSPSTVYDTTRETNNKKLIGQINYILDNGKYWISVVGSDFNDTTKKDLFEQEIFIYPEDSQKVTLSDIELATSVKKSDNNKSPFYKNTLEIIPNPSGLFGMNLSELNYYVEIYGLTPENVSANYFIQYSVNDLNNSKMISFRKEVKRKSESKADYGLVRIDSLQSGSYVLQILLTDSAKGLSVEKEKKFYVFNNIVKQTQTTESNDYLKSEYANESEVNIDDEFEKIAYIIPNREKKKYESLNSVSDKRKFLYEFWKANDANPNTQVLETKVAFMKRVNEANKFYKEAFTEGWKTDRGRIYIKYGKPDDVENFPFESQSKSYSVWKYNSLEGGGQCVFVEIQHSTGVFRLVHSTFRDELKNDNWKDQISTY